MPFSASKGGPLEHLTDGRTITAAEATRQFGRLQEEVASGPITLTHHGRARMVLLAPEEYARLSDAEAELRRARPEPRREDLSGLPAIALDEMMEGYCELDREDRFVRINRVAEFHFGVARNDLVGRHLREGLPELGDSGLLDMLRAARVEGRAQRRLWRSRLHDGRRVDLKMFPIPGGDGVVGVMFADIDEMFELKRRLGIAEARLRMMQRAAPEAAAVAFDAAGVTLEWPAAAETLLGWRADEIIGRPIEKVLVQQDRDEGRLWAHIVEARRNGRAARRAPRLHRDGRSVELSFDTIHLPEEDIFVSLVSPAPARPAEGASDRPRLP